MKKFKFLLATLLMFTVLSGCTTDEPVSTDTPETTSPTSEEVTIAYSVQTLSNPYFVTVAEGFEKYGAEIGIKTIVTDGKQDAAQQVAQIENFIAQEVDAIIISPVNDKALEDVVKQATDAGITVIAGNQNFPGSQGFVTIPEYALGNALGLIAGEYLAEHFPDEEVEVVVFDYPEIESVIARGDGIREGILEKAPNANIVQSISANTPEKGAAAMESVIQKYPNVQMVCGVNDAAILGAYEVYMASGLETEGFYFGGMDATEQALDLIKQDTVYKSTIDINPAGTGKIFIDTALEVMENGPLTEEIAIDLIPVTIDNVDDFIK